MIMTEMEMATVYRQAKDKKKQITILMEVNGLCENEVRDILFRNGIKPAEMPRKSRSQRQEEMDRLVAESAPVESSVSEPESFPVFTPPSQYFHIRSGCCGMGRSASPGGVCRSLRKSRKPESRDGKGIFPANRYSGSQGRTPAVLRKGAA